MRRIGCTCGSTTGFCPRQRLEPPQRSVAPDRDLKGLRALADEGSTAARFLVSFDELDRRTDDGIRLLHWRTFLTDLWTDVLF